MSRAPTPNIVVGTLLAAICLGLLTGCLTATESSLQWPPQAAQVLVTLLVAAALEQKTLPNQLLGRVSTAIAIPLVCVVAAALFLSARAGAAGRGFDAWEGGLVNGSLAPLTALVLLTLLYRLWPDPHAADDD
jgi:hypothetical protein